MRFSAAALLNQGVWTLLGTMSTAWPSSSLQRGWIYTHEKGMGAPAPWGTLMYFVISYVGVAHSDL